MENNLQPLSGNDLDRLLKQAFLNQDFNQANNQHMLELVNKNALSPKAMASAGFNKAVFSKLFITVSVLVMLAGLIFYFKEDATELKKTNVTQTPVPPAKKEITPNIRVEKTTTFSRHIPATQTTTITEEKIIAPAEIEEQYITVSGYIKSRTNGHYLAGVAVNRLNSASGNATDSTGYFSVSLPKGEQVIEVSLTGYHTYTFSAFMTENVTKTIELTEVASMLPEVKKVSEAYLFPNFTVKQKRANEKEKRYMAKMAAKLKQDKSIRKYALVPATEDKSLESFYMGSGEVTNLEYRTFLFDLIINGRKEEFLIAKPAQALWTNAGGVSYFDTLSKIYFSDKKYFDNPVVNISQAGAELYCQWLAGIANDYREEGKPKLEVRLPYEKEWQHAASAGHKNVVYPWLTDSIQNYDNRFRANFCIQKHYEKFNQPISYPMPIDLTLYTAAAVCMRDRTLATVTVWSYNPNDFYLYGVCGNASELVYTGNGKAVKAKGGNWNSDFEHLKFNSEDEFKGDIKPSPMIGFRTCIVLQK